MHYAIDTFTIAFDVIIVDGWAPHAGVPASSIRLYSGDAVVFDLAEINLPSPDVAAAVGSHAAACRFRGRWYGQFPSDILERGRLQVLFDDGQMLNIDRPALQALENDPCRRVIHAFQELLAAQPPGSMLEIGSRARSGIIRREYCPPGWQYVGCDIMHGDNVDVVADAHALSSVFPAGHFGAAFSVSVFEHLLMPWKVAIELNAVLRDGAPCLIMTHQTWPIHEQPWDFWRVSSDAWAALFNARTGFEIIEAALAEPAYIIPAYMHPVTAFAPAPGGYLSSSVLVRKIGPTTLRWDVEVKEAVSTSYPR